MKFNAKVLIMRLVNWTYSVEETWEVVLSIHWRINQLVMIWDIESIKDLKSKVPQMEKEHGLFIGNYTYKSIYLLLQLWLIKIDHLEFSSKRRFKTRLEPFEDLNTIRWKPPCLFILEDCPYAHKGYWIQKRHFV